LQQPIHQDDLQGWKIIADFKDRLAQAFKCRPQSSPTWDHSNRLLSYDTYLSLFLVALLNPVVRTMRGICAASHLERLQREVCGRPVSPGSFSETQHLLDTDLLAKVFDDLASQVIGSDSAAIPRCASRPWLIQDGSLFEALPRMYWTFWRRQKVQQFQVRLHLSLDLNSASPQRAAVTSGKACERAAWRKMLKPGDAYLGDCYYGEDYQLFGQLEEGGVAFILRIRDDAVVNVQQILALSQADRQTGVIGSQLAHLGARPQLHSMSLRLVQVRTPEGKIIPLVTNLKESELSAGEVALLYKERWRVELFFRWIKCVLGCRHWLAQSPQGVATQIYLALIAALLLQLYTGERPTRRLMEMIQFYLLGVASWEELRKAVEAQQRRAKIKKS
jgi:hypothetical protein